MSASRLPDEEGKMKNRVYVWEIPVRLAHWTIVISMIVLGVTGFYIGSPFISVPGEAVYEYVMGTMRFAHFTAAFFLAVAFILRVYWFIVGNEYANFKGLFPVSKDQLRGMWAQLRYYTFTSNKRPHYAGHNPVAGLSYIVIYLLIFLQGLTGLALYGESHPGGLWWTLFSWLFAITSNNVWRLVHHLLMWIFIAFFLLHLYLGALNDILERSGIISSMVTGYKTFKDKH
jgi:Ni/Fe-hydrogenase 1 B-type cytochrome subunit